MTRILLFGTFDGLHFGHVNLFLQAHEHAQEVCVVVARDNTVNHVKGRPPKYSESQRLQQVLNHPLISHAQLGNHGNKYEVIKELNPHLIGLGYDQKHFVDGLDAFLKEHLPHVRIVRFSAHRENAFKSSIINAGRGRLL